MAAYNPINIAALVGKEEHCVRVYKFKVRSKECSVALTHCRATFCTAEWGLYVDGVEHAQEEHSALSIFTKKSMLMPFTVDDPAGRTPLDAKITMEWDHGCRGGDPSWKYVMRITDKTSGTDQEVEIPACWTKGGKDVLPQPEYREVVEVPPPPPALLDWTKDWNNLPTVDEDGDAAISAQRFEHLLRRAETLPQRPSWPVMTGGEWVGLDVRPTTAGHIVTCCDRIERMPASTAADPLISYTPELCNVPTTGTTPMNEPIPATPVFAIRDASPSPYALEDRV